MTDGVFAIVIALLVLEIHVPELAGGKPLGDALRELRPSFIAFLLSFVVTVIACPLRDDPKDGPDPPRTVVRFAK